MLLLMIGAALGAGFIILAKKGKVFMPVRVGRDLSGVGRALIVVGESIRLFVLLLQ